MKKILLLTLLGMVGMRETMAQTCVSTVSTFPYTQGFESGAGDWVAGGTASSWALGTPAGTVINSAATGTKAWKTNLAGTYNNNEQSFVESPCFNFTSVSMPTISFKIWWNMENSFDKAALQSSIDGGTTWQHVGNIGDPDNWYNNNSTSGPGVGGGIKLGWSGRASTSNGSGGWVTAKHTLTGLGGLPSVKLRVAFGSDGSGVDDGFAFDDVVISQVPPNNVGIAGITSPASAGCGFSAANDVCIRITNFGSAPTTTIPVSYKIGSNPTVNEVASLVIAPGATATYCFVTKANLGTPGTYNFTFNTALTGDSDPSNDVATRTVTVGTTVALSTFPYFQNFESGAGGWVAGGTSSSWALGLPAKPVINSAGSGANSWITNLTGNYPDNEQSFVQSPCFNLSSLVQPIVTLKIWWNSEFSWDGAVLQSSVDGGTTWQNVGTNGDPNNWYNDNSIGGGPGGQPGASAVGWTGRNSTSNGSGGWVTAKHALTGLGGQSSVIFRIAFASDGSGVDDGFAFDDFAVFESPANDVGVVAMTSPVTNNCGFTATENVCVTITNFGSAATTSFPISYKIGTNPTVTETVTTPIAPGATITYCFTTKANLSTGGTYNFTVTTNLTNDGDPSNNSLNSVVRNPVIATFPHIQDFETSTVGSPGVLPAGWSISSNPTTSTFRFEVDTDQPASGTTSGPNADHTTGVAGTGKYVFTESSNGATGNFAFLNSPCINLTGLTTPGVDFWYHMHGATTGSMELQASSDGGTTWTTLTTLTGPQQTANTDPWLKKTVSLAGYTGTIQLRFKGTRGTSTTGDMAIDDVKIYNIPANDAEVTTITLPNNGCGLTATENICISVKNNGATPISNLPVSYTINGGTPVTETMPGPIAAGATVQYCFTTKANLSAAATYTVVGSVAMTGDGDPSNNSKTGTVTSIPTISTLPYTEGFENGNGGWVAGGVSSSWAIGTPAKPVINSAGGGTKSYITGLTASYNNNEQSFVVSPCFNLAGKPDPDFEMKIWWNSEFSWDGAVLQSSIDGGATWQVIGAMGDPNNWYNDNTINGGPGGQPAASAVGWTGRASTSNGSGGWVTAKHKLTGLGGQSSVRLRIAFATDGSGVDDGFAFDDIRIGDNTGNLAINSFVPLTQLCGFGTNEKVEVVLENLGSVPVSGYTISYTVNNGSTTSGPFPAPTVPTLAPGVPTNFTFPVGANLSAAGNYTIVVTVTNPNDPDPSNNTITYTIANATFPNIPPIFDFEAPASGIAALRLVTNSKAAITEGAAASRPLNGQPATSSKGMIMDANTATGWVIPGGVVDPWSTNMDFFSAAYICFAPQGAANPGTPLWLSFDLKQTYKTANANTNFRVTVNGTPIGGNTVNNIPANTYRPPFSGVGGTTEWTKIYIDLTPYKNLPNIQLGLESSVAEPFANGAGPANLIDNIRIQRVDPTGITNKAFQNNISVFPNPSNGVFSVSVPSAKTYTLEVTDLTGRVIRTENVKGNTQLDLSGNAKGVYMLKITSEGISGIQKLIVQ